MSAAIRQILWVYVARSWLGTAYMTGCVGLLVYMLVFGKLAIGLWVLELFMVQMIVSSRLVSVRTYAFGFMAPDYRRRHFNVAMVGTLVLGWLPMMATAHDAMSAAHLFTLCVVSTGVLYVMSHLNLRGMGYLILIVVAFCMGLFFMGLTPRWGPPPWLMAVLLPLGVYLLIGFRKRFLAGAEYDPRLAGASEVHAGSGWVITKRVHQAEMNQANPVTKSLASHWLEDGIARFAPMGQTGVPRLLSLGPGDTLFWRAGWVAAIVTACVSLLMGMPLGDKAPQLLPHFFIAVLLVMCGALAVGYAGSVKWPLGTIWMRAPVASKAALLRTMTGVMIRHIGLNMGIAILSAALLAVCAAALGLGRSAAGWLTFMVCINIGIVGLVAQGVGQALILRRFEVVGTTINWISLLIWGLVAAWLVHPFQEPMTYAATLFAGGFVWGGLLCVLWYRRFYERNDFALVG